jgi:protein dithiol:quinone oxidoreductase
MMNFKLLYTMKLGLFFSALTIFLASLYLEIQKQLIPCPLCIMQRLCILILSIVFLIAIFIKSIKALKWLIGFAGIIACAGIYFASRQLYLQSLPDSVSPSCGPGLNYLIQYFPLKDIFYALFWGAGECAHVQWTFLGFSLPFWSFWGFILLLAGMLFCYPLLNKAQIYTEK